MATKCAINGRQWGAYDGRRQISLRHGPASLDKIVARKQSSPTRPNRGHIKVSGLAGMLLYLSRHQDWVCSGECPEQLPGDVTLEGSHDLLGCATFGSSTFDIGASLGINPHPHDG